MVRTVVCQIALAATAIAAAAQQPIGNVLVQDVSVSGNLEVNNGRAALVGSANVTAKDQTAEITLDRGGKVRVCATSGLHMSAGRSITGAPTLMLALDRGAIEVKIEALSSDFILTPDLRFAIQGAGPLDLRLRVTRNGDTCVENRGSNAPSLHIGDQFGETSYDLRAGQHVLFEHASLKEVVDHESSPCGCPPEPVVSVANAGVTSATPVAPKGAVEIPRPEEQHPFPAAISQGLAPQAGVPSAPSAAVRAQVATTLNYNADSPAAPSTGRSTQANPPPPTSGGAVVAATNAALAAPLVAPSANASSPPNKAEAPLQPPAPSAPDLAHRIGHFFKRLFGKG